MLNEYGICVNCSALIEKQNFAHGPEWESGGNFLCWNFRSHIPISEAEYSSHKFGSLQAEILHSLRMLGYGADSMGDADTFGYYEWFPDFCAILVADSQGFVSATVYDNLEMSSAAWSHLDIDYSEWCENQDECDCGAITYQCDCVRLSW